MPIENDYMRTVRLERKFFPKILEGLNRQVLSYLETSLVDSARLRENLTELYLYVAPLEARRTLKKLTKDQWTTDVLEYLQYFLLRLSVTPVAETTRAKIAAILTQSIEEGWNEATTVQAIRGLLNDRARALKIVRTEVIRAVNFGSMMAAYDSDYLYEKTWLAVNDNRTRKTHKHVSGETKDLLEEFSNGLLFPGDPLGSPREVINCRCRLGFKIKRVNGKPVRKKPVSTLPKYLYMTGLEKGLEYLINETLQR